jgi:RimJ/RimL family protein N-acetyltransferase
MAEHLTSSRLLLRAVQESDLDAFYATRANENTMKFWYGITRLFLPAK